MLHKKPQNWQHSHWDGSERYLPVSGIKRSYFPDPAHFQMLSPHTRISHVFRNLFPPLFYTSPQVHAALCVTGTAPGSQGRVYKTPEGSICIFHLLTQPPHMTEEIFCKQFSHPPNAYLMGVFSEKHYKNFQIETISIHSNLHLLFPISKAAGSALILTPACSTKPSAGE